FPDANNVFPDANNGFPDAQPPADAFSGPQPDGAVLGMACIEAQSQPNSDACADAIDLTADATSGGALIYGDTSSYTNYLEPDSACTDGFGLDGPDAMYKVDATAGQTIAATVTPSGNTFDVGMYILNDCASATPCLAGTDDVAGTGPESLSYLVPTTGTYYIIVDSYVPSANGCYGLQVGVQ
ncbi:MAG TPA: PPC domain-containing protein, partial [Kofleriaceae bacterium]|nr:PPC domain-containing protein [Kofleriaceae bacterium]